MNKIFLLILATMSFIMVGCSIKTNSSYQDQIYEKKNSEIKNQLFDKKDLLYTEKDFIQEIKVPIKLLVPVVDWIMLSKIQFPSFSFYGTLEDLAKLLEILLDKKDFSISVIIIDNKNQAQKNRTLSGKAKVIKNTNQDFNDTIIHIPHFKGTLADLVYLLQESYGIVAETKGNKLFLYRSYTFEAHLPLFSEEECKKLHTAFGFDKDFYNIFYIPESGTLIWHGNYHSLQKMKKWLNSSEAMLTRILFNVLIYESVLEKENTLGFGIIKDNEEIGYFWEKNEGISLSLISPDLFLGPAQKLGINFNAFNIWLKGMIQKGDIKVIQKLLVATKSGKEVTLEVGEKIPYVKEVQSAVEDGTGTLSEVKVNFGEVLSGISIKLKPYYDIQIGHILTTVEISVEDLRRMVNVKAGNKEYERPETSIRKISSTVTMQPGRVYIFGGFALKKSEKTHSFGLTPLLFKNKNSNKRLFFAIHVQIIKIKPIIISMLTF